MDWEEDYLGQYAAEGLYLLCGCTEKEAKRLSQQSPTSRRERETELMKALRVELGKAFESRRFTASHKWLLVS